MGHVGEAAAFGVRTPFERVRNGSGKSDPLPNPEPNGAFSSAEPAFEPTSEPNQTISTFDPAFVGIILAILSVPFTHP